MVDISDVKEVAENARISLEEGEAEQFAEEFEDILEIFDALDQVDTEDVESAFHPVDVEPESREDEKEESLDTEETFRNTGNQDDGFFKGPPA